MQVSKPLAVGIAVAALFAGVIVTMIIVRPAGDAGFVQGPCGDVHWARRGDPVTVLVDQSAAEWVPELKAGVAEWNAKAGCSAIALDSAASTDFAYFKAALERTGHEPVGRVLVGSGPAFDELVKRADSNGHAYLRWKQEDCTIGYGVIQLPDYAPLGDTARKRVAAHEEGHVFGLDHDTGSRSVMFVEGIDQPYEISKHDAALVGSACVPDAP